MCLLKENEGAEKKKSITAICLISANEFGMSSHQFWVKVLLLRFILKRLITHYFHIFLFICTTFELGYWFKSNNL